MKVRRSVVVVPELKQPKRDSSSSSLDPLNGREKRRKIYLIGLELVASARTSKPKLELREGRRKEEDLLV